MFALGSLSCAVPRNPQCLQSWSFARSLTSPHRQHWWSARCHCSDRECLHNISLLFARQKIVLVIASCWLAPWQSRSEWVLFSFPALWVWCLPSMFWHRCQTHALKSFMITSLSDGCTVSKSLSRSLVYVHCDGDVDGVGRRHSVYQGQTGDFRSSERLQAPQRESISRASMPSAQRCLSCCSTGARSCGAACVFSRSLVFFHGTVEGAP